MRSYVAPMNPYWGLRNYGVSGQLGMEATPEEYVATMVDVFRHVRRVLRPDGVLFVNLGDSYAGSGKGPSNSLQPDASQIGNVAQDLERRERAARRGYAAGSNFANYGLRNERAGVLPQGLKPKDLVGMPWRFALALQADGWWWRSTIVWAKKACMPESVSDRPTNAWEPILLFSRSRSYFWDGDAVREDVAEPGRSSGNIERFIAKGNERGRLNTHMGSAVPLSVHGTGRNLRNVWDLRGEPVSDFWLLGPEPFPGAHFATFPSEVPRRCILAGTSEKGQCPHCGAPWERIVERAERVRPLRQGKYTDTGASGTNRIAGAAYEALRRPDTTVGWRPSCACPAHEPVPQTILDPFGGALTTALVAARLGRDSVSIELNAQYAEMGAERIRQDAGFMASIELHEVGA